MPWTHPGPGWSASSIQAWGIGVEGSSSAHSGSSQQPTASTSSSKAEQGMGTSPQHQQVPCRQHHLLLPSPFLSVSPDATLLRRSLGSCQGFLAASSSTFPHPKACEGTHTCQSTAPSLPCHAEVWQLLGCCGAWLCSLSALSPSAFQGRRRAVLGDWGHPAHPARPRGSSALCQAGADTPVLQACRL